MLNEWRVHFERPIYTDTQTRTGSSRVGKGKPGMGTEENKAVVRRFMNEVLRGGNLDVADEVLAPNYVNVAMGDADLAGLKAMVAATHAALREQRFDDEELVADGDAVFARFNYTATLPDGSTTTVRAMAYYRLADGRIVVNDVMFDPDLMSLLGPLMTPPPDTQS
jgi:hypothetical protein